jgi:hypothetical protein
MKSAGESLVYLFTVTFEVDTDERRKDGIVETQQLLHIVPLPEHSNKS